MARLRSPKALSREIESLRTRLREAEETLHAIRSGSVDAIVVSGHRGEQVFILQGADQAYRIFVQEMSEGAVIIQADQTILHCNRAFARLTGSQPEKLTGGSFFTFLAPADRAAFELLLQSVGPEAARCEVSLLAAGGSRVPVQLSANLIQLDGSEYVCVIATDLTGIRRAEEALRSSEEALRRQSESLRELAAHLQTIREQERTGIAREIHDELGQSLTAIKIGLAWLAARLPAESDERLRVRAESTLRLVDGTIHAVRRISTALRPSVLDSLGLGAAIEWQAREFQSRTGIRCRVALATEELDVPPQVATGLFRIFQETLTNVARHSGATRVQARLRHDNGFLVLQVRDNGKGFDTTQLATGNSLGLLGMRERAAILHGYVAIQSVVGKGTTVTTSVPVSEAGATEAP